MPMKKCSILFAVLLVLAACKEKYIPELPPGKTQNLVVDGYISAGGENTRFVLSRTTGLDTIQLDEELHASVTVEGDDQSSFPIYEHGNGIYEGPTPGVSDAHQYRVRIITSDGREYLSDFVPVRYSPDIDSISWKYMGDGVQLYVHSHDLSNNTRYYRWAYDETWEFHSAYVSSLTYAYGPDGMISGLAYRNPLTREPDLTIYTCWKSEASTNILIGSSAKLASDVIYLPLIKVPRGSVKMSVMYSINLRQYAISSTAYDFLDRMKRNTESVGTIFDPQPSALNSNIHCLSNPNESVIGFITAGDVKEKRIFISNQSLPNWGYQSGCSAQEVKNDVDSIRAYSFLVPTIPAQTDPFGNILTYLASVPTCVDCTLRGTNQKPSFWP